MSVSEVVSLWNQYIRPEGQKGKYLVSPSVTTAPTGIDQLQQFFDTCGGSDKCGVRASINLISRWLITPGSVRCHQSSLLWQEVQ